MSAGGESCGVARVRREGPVGLAGALREVLVGLASVSLLACGGAQVPLESVRSARRAVRGTSVASYDIPLAQRPSFDRNCPEGAPMLEPAWEHGAVRTIGRAGYALVHSSVDLVPLFVCEGISVAQITGPLPRPNPAPFAPDPDLPVGERSELVDYRYSGFDRGHMAPSADQTGDATLQAETYFLSNMAPQVGVGFNQHAWARLESTVRDWLEARGGGWIVTGPMFYDPAEEEPRTRDGIGPRQGSCRLTHHRLSGPSPSSQGRDAVG